MQKLYVFITQVKQDKDIKRMVKLHTHLKNF